MPRDIVRETEVRHRLMERLAPPEAVLVGHNEFQTASGQAVTIYYSSVRESLGDFHRYWFGVRPTLAGAGNYVVLALDNANDPSDWLWIPGEFLAKLADHLTVTNQIHINVYAFECILDGVYTDLPHTTSSVSLSAYLNASLDTPAQDYELIAPPPCPDCGGVVRRKFMSRVALIRHEQLRYGRNIVDLGKLAPGILDSWWKCASCGEILGSGDSVRSVR